jgi:hypothetical protein
LFTLAQQQGMIWVGTGMLPSSTKNAKHDDINYLSSFAGLATASPSDASVDEIPTGDLATALLFGQRIAAVTSRIKGRE